jgi:hypothetical protein
MLTLTLFAGLFDGPSRVRMCHARVLNNNNNKNAEIDHIANHNNPTTIDSVDIILGPKLHRQREHTLNISSGNNSNLNRVHERPDRNHDRRQSNPARIERVCNHDAGCTIARGQHCTHRWRCWWRRCTASHWRSDRLLCRAQPSKPQTTTGSERAFTAVDTAEQLRASQSLRSFCKQLHSLGRDIRARHLRLKDTLSVGTKDQR